MSSLFTFGVVLIGCFIDMLRGFLILLSFLACCVVNAEPKDELLALKKPDRECPIEANKTCQLTVFKVGTAENVSGLCVPISECISGDFTSPCTKIDNNMVQCCKQLMDIKGQWVVGLELLSFGDEVKNVYFEAHAILSPPDPVTSTTNVPAPTTEHATGASTQTSASEGPGQSTTAPHSYTATGSSTTDSIRTTSPGPSSTAEFNWNVVWIALALALLLILLIAVLTCMYLKRKVPNRSPMSPMETERGGRPGQVQPTQQYQPSPYAPAQDPYAPMTAAPSPGAGQPAYGPSESEEGSGDTSADEDETETETSRR